MNLAKNKLNSLYPRRHKRGLINALGTVIKYVAGNPDQDDLEIIQNNFGKISTFENRIVINQEKQIKINNVLEKTINKVSLSIAKISKQIKANNENIRRDVEEINLILNLDIITKTLEDIEEQLIFSKSAILNKNILSTTDKEYITEYFRKQSIKLHFDDEIFEFVKCIATIKDNHVIFVIKIPIVEDRDYDLIQLETTSINGSRINTDIKYVAKFKRFTYKQTSRCVLCDNTQTLNDECVYSILNNQAATCNMSKDIHQVIVKEIIPGTILLDTRTGVHVTDSCGDNRIIATPTIIEIENCTIKILNETFSQTFLAISNPEFSTPIFGKQIEYTNNTPSVEEIHQINLENLEELTRIRLRLFKSQAIGGIAITSITIFLLIVVYLHRYRMHRHEAETDDAKNEVISQDTTASDESSTPSRFDIFGGKSNHSKFIPLPKLQNLMITKESNEDVRHLRGEAS